MVLAALARLICSSERSSPTKVAPGFKQPRAIEILARTATQIDDRSSIRNAKQTAKPGSKLIQVAGHAD